MTPVRQIPGDRLKSSMQPVAVLGTTLDQLSSSLGIRPETHNRNLGEQREAFLEADDGSQYMLVQFSDGPTNDVELRAEDRTANPDWAIDRFLESATLSPELVVWRVSSGDWTTRREAESREGQVRRAGPRSAGEGREGAPGYQVAAGTRGREIDVCLLIDKLDDLVHSAKSVPLTDQLRVDGEEISEILDQMRATISEEINQARWIVKERQEMLAEATREAERIVQEARERQERLISEEITRQAERAAEDIIEEARVREREIRLGAEDYADEVLNTLEVNLSKFLAAVRRGRDRLAGTEESAQPVRASERRHRSSTNLPSD